MGAPPPPHRPPSPPMCLVEVFRRNRLEIYGVAGISTRCYFGVSRATLRVECRSPEPADARRPHRSMALRDARVRYSSEMQIPRPMPICCVCRNPGVIVDAEFGEVANFGVSRFPYSRCSGVGEKVIAAGDSWRRPLQGGVGDDIKKDPFATLHDVEIDPFPSFFLL